MPYIDELLIDKLDRIAKAFEDIAKKLDVDTKVLRNYLHLFNN